MIHSRKKNDAHFFPPFSEHANDPEVKYAAEIFYVTVVRAPVCAGWLFLQGVA